MLMSDASRSASGLLRASAMHAPSSSERHSPNYYFGPLAAPMRASALCYDVELIELAGRVFSPL